MSWKKEARNAWKEKAKLVVQPIPPIVPSPQDVASSVAGETSEGSSVEVVDASKSSSMIADTDW
jgi:hypothetical protein